MADGMTIESVPAPAFVAIVWVVDGWLIVGSCQSGSWKSGSSSGGGCLNAGIEYPIGHHIYRGYFSGSRAYFYDVCRSDGTWQRVVDNIH